MYLIIILAVPRNWFGWYWIATCAYFDPIHTHTYLQLVKKRLPSRLKNLKMTAGLGGIASVLVHICRRVLIYSPTRISGLLLALLPATIPHLWKSSKMSPVLTRGSQVDMRNFRSICILDNYARTFESVLYARIYPMVKHVISPDYYRFTKSSWYYLYRYIESF